jgi:hypothetical protein
MASRPSPARSCLRESCQRPGAAERCLPLSSPLTRQRSRPSRIMHATSGIFPSTVPRRRIGLGPARKSPVRRAIEAMLDGGTHAVSRDGDVVRLPPAIDRITAAPSHRGVGRDANVADAAWAVVRSAGSPDVVARLSSVQARELYRAQPCERAGVPGMTWPSVTRRSFGDRDAQSLFVRLLFDGDAVSTSRCRSDSPAHATRYSRSSCCTWCRAAIWSGRFVYPIEDLYIASDRVSRR